MIKKTGRLVSAVNRGIVRIDNFPLWWVGFILLAIAILPNLLLREGSVFTVHDQLDESMMNYVLTARHLGEGTVPEMLGGINASGLQPSAVLFSLLYCVLPAFGAFLCTYILLILCGFEGMYFCVREMTDSSILAVLAAGCFCMLPLYPVYGLSQMGIPLILYAYLRLNKVQKPWGRQVVLPLALVLFFGLNSHLVYTGYVVLAFWAVAILVALIKKRFVVWSGVGFGLLLLTYVLTNLNLFAEILLGTTLNGQTSYVSHREEMINSAMPFWKTVKTVFAESAQHAFTYHTKLILPIVIILTVGAFFYKKMDDDVRKRYVMALGGLAVLAGIAVFYGICKSEVVVNFKNSVTGFLHYFQMERFYWIYPAGWYLELALVCSFGWTAGKKQGNTGGIKAILISLPVQLVVIALMVLPTVKDVLYNSDFYRNVNQRNNGMGITGYITWESYYAEDLMAQIEEAIGREMSEYRIAHLGISPAPSLMHGFYTVDGYSNNYPLEYKHAFRRVIAAELDKTPETAVYFDAWGNRCYLFNSQTGNYWMVKKGSGVVYEDLEFDMEALAALGCEYLLSGGEIADAEEMGLEPLGYFETEKSYWGIWLYELQNVS